MAYAGFGPFVGQALQTDSLFTSVPYYLSVLALNVMACKRPLQPYAATVPAMRIFAFA